MTYFLFQNRQNQHWHKIRSFPVEFDVKNLKLKKMTLIKYNPNKEMRSKH